MYVFIVDIFAVLLFAGGAYLVAKPPGADSWRGSNDAGPGPGTYARRIAGTMMAAFGLAIGLMVTLFHFASFG